MFAHEYGHDLGLPDLYDTNGGENGTAFWTIMSVGSWLGHGEDDIGTTPDYMGPWEKLQLGWLDYAVVSEGEGGAFTLSPAARQVDGQEQAVIIDVPDQGIETEYVVAEPGRHAWWTSQRRRSEHDADAHAGPEGRRERHGEGQGLVRHRGRLRLPPRRVLNGRRGLD